ncbi:putative ABC multidrug transporter [Aspergillus steynii IBT 23096]|uniref:Putative ABC multidrug transporter n=1 Tax=Aspergillus steynii IBT 23096 TaxID=1392250 RepID=A0A2I2G0F4_9EURO|nr:putative ABC multidrug transporter [Aspergillus steynii IBT 23096]PLB46368.1 putative ABC multidrug transporter [Aspergillus steynii IBT 23096]
MIAGLICAMGSGVALPLMNIVFGQLVGDFNDYFIPGKEMSEDTFKSTVNKNSLYILYLFIGKFVLTYIAMFCFRLISLQASATLRLEYTTSLFSQPLSALDEISSGTVTHAITSLSNQIQQSISDKLATLFQAIALLIAAYAIAFRYSWALTLVVSSAILFVVIGFSITVPFIIKAQAHVDQADAKHASIAADVLSSIRTVLSLSAERPLSAKYSSWIAEARKRGKRLTLVSGIHLGLLMLALYSSYALAFWFGLKLFREGHIDNINTVITVFFSVLIVVSIIGNIASPIMVIGKATSASGPFFDMIDAQPPSTAGRRDPEVSSHADIVFRDVTFAYPTRPGVQVLKDFSARFERGKTTALVGPSGSGKSTVVGLIERWYQVQKETATEKDGSCGEIEVDGHNLNDLDLRWWRSEIGLVQQEPFLFNDTVLNNVALGLIGSRWENAEEGVKKDLITQACIEVFADEFIQRLPLGYETLVGEGGITLSGGQRQRLAIARSIVSQPPILILDEATSSIDVRGEKIVQAALDRVSKDRTTIMIAHRLSTVRRADRIIVMKDGTKMEEGTHQDLLAHDGVYSGLVHAQQLGTLSLDSDEQEELPTTLTSNLKTTGLVGLTEKETAENQHPEKKQKMKGLRSFLKVGSEQRASWPLFVLILIAAMAAGSGFALQSWLFARLIEVFQFTGQKLVDAANFWALMFFILALAMSGFYFILGVGANSTSVNIASVYRTEYFVNMLAKPVSWYDSDENASGSLISRLSTDPKQLQELFGVNGVFPLVSIFNVIGCIAVSFTFGPKLAAVAFFAALPFLFMAAYSRIRYEMKFEELNAAVYEDSSRFATEAVRAFRTVSALTMEESIIKRYSDMLNVQRRKAMRKATYSTLIFAFSESVELAVMALTFWYGGQLLASREYDMVSFFVVYIAIIQGGQTAGQFFSFGPNMAQASASANRILGSRAPVPSEAELSKEPLSLTKENSRADIQFKNVSFRYPSRDTPTFMDLNLSIESGQFVAFVGPSGCGKSTMISLLERFYDATRGKVEFGGRDVCEIELSSYRMSLSLVSQEPKLFDGTIRDNLILGLDRPEGTIESDMIQACQDAEIHDFIISLPDGYSTELGVNAQTALSGGQKQRLCIARALMRKPLLLLLDEATSSLDSQSERLVQNAMERLAGKRSMTIIAVAHRLATIQNADVIFVFGEEETGKGSRIVERGTHADLLRQKGAYWQMVRTNLFHLLLR